MSMMSFEPKTLDLWFIAVEAVMCLAFVGILISGRARRRPETLLFTFSAGLGVGFVKDLLRKEDEIVTILSGVAFAVSLCVAYAVWRHGRAERDEEKN